MVASMIVLGVLALISGWLHVRALLRRRARALENRRGDRELPAATEHGLGRDADALADIDAEAHELWLAHQRARGGR